MSRRFQLANRKRGSTVFPNAGAVGPPFSHGTPSGSRQGAIMYTSRFLSILAILILAIPALAGAQVGYTEDFTTTTYKDDINTTAYWNTAAGELKLYPLPQFVGSYDTPGQAYDVEVAGDLAFVADYTSGLRVIDISDPAAPTSVGAYDTPGAAYGVAVAGDLAFVTDWTGGLVIIDIGDPTTPTLIATSGVASNAYGVAVDGDHAFVADYNFGLRIIDISNPAAPTLAGSYSTPAACFGVAVTGDLAFLACSLSGLLVIDISDPANPTLAGSYDTPGSARNVAIAGDLALVADYHSGLQVIDISDPTNPSLTGTYNTASDAFEVFVDGNYAYVADYSAGLVVVDISDPANPTLMPSVGTAGLALSVTVAGEHAFVGAHDSGLQVFQVASVMPPLLAANYNTGGTSLDVTTAGDYAFVADGGEGLKVIDISDPTNPTLAGSYDTPSYAQGVAVAGDLALVADGVAGLQLIDISDPTNPTLAGSYNTPGNANRVRVAGDYAFVADGAFGMQIIDISDPTNPSLTGNYDTGANTRDIAVAGDHAFIAASLQGLLVIDISDPTNPTPAGSDTHVGYAYAVTVAGDLALVTNSPGILLTIDVSDPTNPTPTGSYVTPNVPYAVTVAGDLAFVADADSGLQVIDISDPTAPTFASELDTPGSAWSVAVAGDYAFGADSGSGLRVIQVLEREVDARNDVGQSLALDGATESLYRMRVSANQTSGVSWEVSGDDGGNWQAIAPNNVWNLLIVPGTAPLWRATLTWSAGLNPTASEVTVEWLNESAVITSITDIPNDQGRQVSLEWIRSGHDFVGDPSQIVEYGIYRKIDPNLFVAQSPAAMQILEELSPAVREHTMAMQAAGWHFLTTVPVRAEDYYAVVVPTLADSTIVAGDYNSTFMVTAFTATPAEFFDSPPDSGYSVDNLAPGVPQAFTIAYNTGSGNTLSWDEAPEPDFQYYRVYRSSDPNFTPAPGNLVHETATAGWADPEYDGGMIYYKITALDYSGNESDPASAGEVTSVPLPEVPETFALHQNYPNPFNPTTVIAYDVPRAGSHVTLRVYDVNGALVRTLVDGVLSEGRQHTNWDGRDALGRSVATGAYFYRLTAPGFEKTRKMVLLK
jgi:hypothetical protein